MADIQHCLSQQSLKFKLHVKRFINPQTGTSEDKSKQITKYRLSKCTEHCLKHRFSLVKVKNNKDKQRFVIDKYGVNYNYCPYHHELVNIHEGGVPRFNNDRRVETPAFILKFDTLIDTEALYMERFKDVLAKATNQTLYTSDCRQKVVCTKRSLVREHNDEFQNKVDELKAILIRKDQQHKQKQE